MEVDFNWFAIIVAALVPMLIGYIWYVPLFGKQWQKSMGFTDEQVNSGNMPLIYGVSTLMAFIFAFGLKAFIEIAHSGSEGSFHTFQHGLFHGAMIAILFAIPILVSNSLFQKNSWKNILINVGYWILTAAVMGGIVDAWL